MADLKDTILLNSKKIEVKNVQHDITLLDWLRNYRKITGTKEGCAEGDCGACSVIINDDGSGSSRPINSCLVRLGQVIGSSVTTIEGLGCDKNPHPLQIAFTNEHASQCGYCTPGFIMSGISLLNSNKKITDDTINDAISGNLCRCTGYSPIIKAIKSVANNRISQTNNQSIKKNKKISLGNVTYFKPSNLKELKNYLIKTKNFQFLAGGTDLNLQRPIINQKEDKIICLENTWYSVISPEGCASILFRDPGKAEEAADAMRVTAKDLKEIGIADEIVKEPDGAAHISPDKMYTMLKETIIRTYTSLKNYSLDELIKLRFEKYDKIGFYEQR